MLSAEDVYTQTNEVLARLNNGEAQILDGWTQLSLDVAEAMDDVDPDSVHYKLGVVDADTGLAIPPPGADAGGGRVHLSVIAMWQPKPEAAA